MNTTLNTDNKPQKIQITLTDRPPVSIDKEAWPKIAAASGDSYGGSDYARHQQALGQGECDKFFITVRQHADGRTLVYGKLNAADAAWGAPAGGEDWAGGYLVGKDNEDIVEAIKKIGHESRIPGYIVRDCIADLPAEEL